MEWEQLKEKFKDVYIEHIRRPGSADLLAWLANETDFFTAPASTKHHLAYTGGLVEHSLNVFRALHERVPLRECTETNMETVAIVALLHDICKANYYHYEPIRRNPGPELEMPKYIVKDAFPFGHGEKSCFLIQRFMQLTDEEALAIRWHMGAYDDAARGGSRGLNEAMKLYQLVYELHAADMRATHSMERGKA